MATQVNGRRERRAYHSDIECVDEVCAWLQVVDGDGPSHGEEGEPEQDEAVEVDLLGGAEVVLGGGDGLLWLPGDVHEGADEVASPRQEELEVLCSPLLHLLREVRHAVGGHPCRAVVDG